MLNKITAFLAIGLPVLILIIFIVMGYFFCRDFGVFREQCHAKGGIVVDVNDRYMCMKKEMFL